MLNSDQIISALYLAKTDNREKMLSDFILNILYTLDEAVSTDELLLFIKDSFHLDPIKYEVDECLILLTDKSTIRVENGKYLLDDKAKFQIQKLIAT